MKKNNVSNNIIMLYIMNITQLILPLITLPYLTRVLSVDNYGVVSYVKSLTVYITLIIEFGFLLSGTKEIVLAKFNKQKIRNIIGTITLAKLILSIFAFLLLLVMIYNIPILRRHTLFTILSFWGPFLSIFLFDYLFRGLEKMQIITYRYLVMKGISTTLTFILVKGDSQLNLIPILDIIGSLVAVIWVFYELKKMEIYPAFHEVHNVWSVLRISAIYFLSNVASTAFGAFNTLLVGIYLSSREVAYWGVIMSLIAAVQSLYSPISDGIYPYMISKKSLTFLTKIILFFIPLLFLGSCIAFFGAKLILNIIGGSRYLAAYKYLQESVPMLIISFFTMMFGWPALGTINKVKETTLTTFIAAIVQVIGLVFLIVNNMFTISSIIIVRTISEFSMMLTRFLYIIKYHNDFNYKG